MSESKILIENPLESLSMTVPFSCRDWATEKRDAWVWGIICGWGDDCQREFEQKFGWDVNTFGRLKRLHTKFEEMRRAQSADERTGRWVPVVNTWTQDEHVYGATWYKCDQCGRLCETKQPYCHCGAHMIEGEEHD
ncbi:hypothetical protein [Oscillibacter ruminantium]|uniref:hypothetical protein n=1 Tax=Oscillibacter ruminantium TaxID=1263547 RepID=UPI00058BEE0D|nr:hypothetical protein [Oscillibacter ruminantium]